MLATKPHPDTVHPRPMQLFWIPRTADPVAEAPPLAPEEPRQAIAPVRPSPPPSPTDALPAPEATARVQAAPRENDNTLPAATAWDDARPAGLIDPLLLRIPEGTAADSGPARAPFTGGRDTLRLPGGGPAKVEGIVVGTGPSLEDRVQGVLALVGLGKVNPCPDIRTHVQSAIAAGDPDEVQYWINKQRRCR